MNKNTRFTKGKKTSRAQISRKNEQKADLKWSRRHMAVTEISTVNYNNIASNKFLWNKSVNRLHVKQNLQ